MKDFKPKYQVKKEITDIFKKYGIREYSVDMVLDNIGVVNFAFMSQPYKDRFTFLHLRSCLEYRSPENK